MGGQVGFRWRRRIAQLLTAVVLLVLVIVLGAWWFLRASLPQLDGVRQAPGLAGPVTVARDVHGVPMLTAVNRADLAYATGFIHAQDRFFQMDLMRRSGAGELAELFGPKALPLDRNRRVHRFRARAAVVLAAMPLADRRFLERYADGVNAGLHALAARPFEYALIRTAPRDWQAADSLLVAWAMYFDLQSMQEGRKLARSWVAEHADAAQAAFLLPASTSWDAPLDAAAINAPLPAIPAQAPAWWGAARAAGLAHAAASGGAGLVDLADLAGLSAMHHRGAWPAPPLAGAAAALADGVGSNNWAVAGARTVDGRAIVSNDMHLGLQLPNTWYRIGMQYRDGKGATRRLVGLTLPGTPPVLLVGSNGHIAWSYTNSYGDFFDLVGMVEDAAHPGQVRSAAGWQAVTTHTETIKVKGAADVRLVVRDTTLGPLRSVGGRLYAMHWIAHHPDALNGRNRLLEESDSVTQALAVAPTVGMPAQNFVVGDGDGHIGWTIIGPLPRRVPGDAGASWDGVLAPADYPRLIDPDAGIVSTANSRQLAGPAAALIGDGGFDLGARNRQARDALQALGNKATIKDVYGVMLDDRALFMDGWRQRALALLDADALREQPGRAEFARLLRDGWTGRASTNAVGYRLARSFLWSLYEEAYGTANAELAALDGRADMHAASTRWPVVLGRLLDEQPAGWLPPGYPSWRAFQLAAVDRAIAELGGADGSALAAASWGQRNTAAIVHPITLALPQLRRWLGAPADQLPGDANMPRVAGSKFGQSERLTVSPGKEEAGVFNMPGGQSGHPLSPYFLDGHADWVAGRPLPLLPGAPAHTLRFEAGPVR